MNFDKDWLIVAICALLVACAPAEVPDVQIRKCMAAGQIFNPRCADEWVCRKPARREM